jgi:hypothetical protein
MIDGGRIVGGLALVLVVVTGPAWVEAVRGVDTEMPLLTSRNERCIEPREQMRRDHPALLANWRERAVRLGERIHHTVDERPVRIGLTGTCLGCHGAATEFCDRCHAQVGVTLSCWQCHEGSTRGAQ